MGKQKSTDYVIGDLQKSLASPLSEPIAAVQDVALQDLILPLFQDMDLNKEDCGWVEHNVRN